MSDSDVNQDSANEQHLSDSWESDSTSTDSERESESTESDSTPGTSWGNTKLLFKLLQGPEYESDLKIVALIEAGCDVNAKRQGRTLLHWAIGRPTTAVSLKLLKEGADVNAQSNWAQTVLHSAIVSQNLEAVALCLYYGADTSRGLRSKPLEIAVLGNQLEIALTLLDFYNKDDAVALLIKHIHIPAGYELLVGLVRAGASVNQGNLCGDSLLLASFRCEDSALFKLVWDKVDKTLVSRCPQMMLSFLDGCAFSPIDWLGCFYAMLEDPAVVEVVEGFQRLQLGESAFRNERIADFLFILLLGAFERKRVPGKDRVQLIYFLLSLGFKVWQGTFQHVHKTYGYNEELQALIYCGNCKPSLAVINHTYYLMPSFILSVGAEPSPEDIASYFCKVVRFCMFVESPADNNYTRYMLKFFSLPLPLKNALLDECRQYLRLSRRLLARVRVLAAARSGSGGSEINRASSRVDCEVLKFYKEIQKMPEIPSLLELSRNEVRRVISQKFAVRRTYQLHDVVKQLDLPQVVEEMICYKRPVY